MVSLAQFHVLTFCLFSFAYCCHGRVLKVHQSSFLCDSAFLRPFLWLIGCLWLQVPAPFWKPFSIKGRFSCPFLQTSARACQMTTGLLHFSFLQSTLDFTHIGFYSKCKRDLQSERFLLQAMEIDL